MFAGSQSPYIIIQKTVMEYMILKGIPNILPRGTLILKYTIKENIVSIRHVHNKNLKRGMSDREEMEKHLPNIL